MFSGLTNQMSSWMGAVKGDQDEEVPQPVGGAAGSEEQPQPPQEAPQATEVATAAGDEQFENVPVGEDENGKATRFVFQTISI